MKYKLIHTLGQIIISILFCAIAFIFINTANAGDQRWLLIKKTEDEFKIEKTYLATKSIKGDPNKIISIWMKSVDIPKKGYEKLPYVADMKAYAEYDCQNRKKRLMKTFIKFNDGTMKYQDIESNDDASYGIKTYGHWNDVMPDTEKEKEFNIVCEQAKKNKTKKK